MMKKRMMEPINIGSKQEQGFVSVEKNTNQTTTPLNGVPLDFRGSHMSHPDGAQDGWCYYNQTDGLNYAYYNGTWCPIAFEQISSMQADFTSVYAVYHNNILSITPPTPTGDGTTDGWHTDSSAKFIWISLKVAVSISDGTWSDPIPISPCRYQSPNLFSDPNEDMADYKDVASQVICNDPLVAGKAVTLQFEYQYKSDYLNKIDYGNWIECKNGFCDKFTISHDFFSEEYFFYAEIEIQAEKYGEVVFGPIVGGQPRYTPRMPYLAYSNGYSIVSGMFKVTNPAWEGLMLGLMEEYRPIKVRSLRYGLVSNKINLHPKVDGEFKYVEGCPEITFTRTSGKCVTSFLMMPQWKGLKFAVDNFYQFQLCKEQLELGNVATEWSVSYDEFIKNVKAYKADTIKSLVSDVTNINATEKLLMADPPFQFITNIETGKPLLYLNDEVTKRLAGSATLTDNLVDNKEFTDNLVAKGAFTDQLATNDRFTNKLATNKKFVEKLPSNRTVDTRLSGQKKGVVVGMGDNVITAYNVSGIDTVVIDGGFSPNVIPMIRLKNPTNVSDCVDINPGGTQFSGTHGIARVDAQGFVGMINGVGFGCTSAKVYCDGASLSKSVLSLAGASLSGSELRMDQVLLSKNALSLAQSWLSGTELKMDKLSLTKDKLSLDGASFGSDGITLPKGAKAIMPGALVACMVRADGTIEYSYDGPIKGVSSIKLGTGEYEITHNIGHAYYVATATARGQDSSNNSCIAITYSQNDRSIRVDIKKSTNGVKYDADFSLTLIGKY